MQTSIRRWGNSAGAIIPAAILKKAGVTLDDALEVEVADGCIVLRLMEPRFSLAELLKASPAAAIAMSEEDHQWLGDKPVGRELL